MNRVELFEHIRKDHHWEKLSIRALAKKYHVHRRTIRQALDSPVPPKRVSPGHRAPVVTETIKVTIKTWLQADQSAPKKQRHTAHRIYTRLVNELDFQGKEPTIRKLVGQLRRELALTIDAFVPQVYVAGEEAEVDWYEV